MADLTDILVAELLKKQDSYRSDPLYQLGMQTIGSFPIGKEYNMKPWERLAAGLLQGLGGSFLISQAKANAGSEDKTLKLAKALTADPAERQAAIAGDPELAKYDTIANLLDEQRKQELSDFGAKERIKAIADAISGRAPRWDVQTPQGVTEQHTMIYDPKTGEIKEGVYGRGQSPFDKKLQEAKAEAVAGNTLYGGGFDPKKQAEIEDSMRKELKGGIPVEQFQKGETAFQNMLAAYPDTSGASDLDFLYGAVQTREPGMAVRKDDQDLARAANGIGGIFADAAGYITSGRKFTPEMRQDMLRAAGRARDARIELLQQDFDTAKGIAERRKIDPKNIVPFEVPIKSEALLDKVIPPPPNMTFEQFQAWKRRQGK